MIITGVVLLACAALGVGAYLWHHRSRPVQTDKVSNKHFSGPTEQEKADSEAHKDDIVKQQNEDKQNQGNGSQDQKTVTPIITDASQNGTSIRVAGYVSGIFEDGGTCTITITKGTAKITKTAQAFANVSTTQCSPVTIDRSEFPDAGQWQVTLAYNSAAAKGTSQAQQLAIQ